VLPRTHAFVIRAAVASADSAWLSARLSDLLSGHLAEDDFVIAGVHWRAPGLTHSYRPGSRFGELGAPSAKRQLERCLRRARAAASDERAAHWLGRGCHLLGDAAVPARTRGVWHLLGDPLERYWEQLSEAQLSELTTALPEATGSALDQIEHLARRSSALPADTTRTPWGAARFYAQGRGIRLGDAQVAQQARELLP
jgi:hypothetical protein